MVTETAAPAPGIASLAELVGYFDRVRAAVLAHALTGDELAGVGNALWCVLHDHLRAPPGDPAWAGGGDPDAERLLWLSCWDANRDRPLAQFLADHGPPPCAADAAALGITGVVAEPEPGDAGETGVLPGGTTVTDWAARQPRHAAGRDAGGALRPAAPLVRATAWHERRFDAVRDACVARWPLPRAVLASVLCCLHHITDDYLFGKPGTRGLADDLLAAFRGVCVTAARA